MSIQPQEKFKVLLIGDNCEDVYVYGTVNRISPETPVPVLRQTDIVVKNGMAGNVRDNLNQLGAITHTCSNCPLQITKTRYVDKKSGYHLLRLDRERQVDAWDYRTPDALDSYDAVIVSDYNKGFVTYEHYKYLTENYNGPVFVDTKKTDLQKLEGFFVKINNLEYSRLETECSHLIVTQGKDGATYQGSLYPAPEVEVFDVCGAGDTFLSALAYKYLETSDMSSAIQFANRAAALTVQHNGNYAPRLEEIS